MAHRNSLRNDAKKQWTCWKVEKRSRKSPDSWEPPSAASVAGERKPNTRGKKSKRGPGKESYLSKQQIKKLERELLKGAYAHGYAEDYWTLDRIGHVIWELFQVRYVPSGVWRLLTRMGWSEAADLIVKGMEGAIHDKIVTYDFARLMEGATEVKCSEFADAIIERM